MFARIALASIALTLTFARSTAATDEPTKPSGRELLRARLAEDAKKTPLPAKKSATPSTAPASTAATTASAAGESSDAALSAAGSPKSAPAKAQSAAKAKAAAKAKEVAAAKEEPTVLLPKVEVKKGRITVLDQKLAKQEMDLARERKNLQVSEVDSAFNDSRIARPLAIFGGDSSQFRQSVASERVQLMEAEKDLIEAIAHAKTKEEKAELQKQLNELKAMRRELDKTRR
jgi:uncharacterized membrane protein